MKGTFKILLVLLLTLKCISKHSIDDIKEALKTEMSSFFGRTAQGQASYQAFRQKLKQQQKSLPEFIKNQKFGFDGEAEKPIFQLLTLSYERNWYKSYMLGSDKSDFPWIKEQFQLQSSISSLSNNETFLILTINDFPYDTEDHIDHCLVWSNFQIDLKLVELFLDSIIAEGYSHFAYINPPNRKSIPEIFHAQIFVYRQLVDEIEL